MPQPAISEKKYSQLVLLLIFAGVLLRSAGLSRPLLGNFAIYQTAQAMIANFFIEQNFSNWLYPQVNVIAEGKPGLILLYYPVSSLLVAFAHALTRISVDLLGRAHAVLFFALAAIYVVKLVERLLSRKEALGALAVFCFLPLSVIYGQSFQNEMLTVFFSVFFFFYFLKGAETLSLSDALKASLGLSVILLTRPNNLFLGLPALYLLWAVGEAKFPRKFFWGIGVLMLSAILPIFWYWHVWKVSAEHSNIYSTLFAQLMVRSSFISALALQGSYYAKVFLQLAGIVLTPVGFMALLLALFRLPKSRADWFFIFWLLGFLLSSILIPRKLLEHNFYWLHFIVPASVFMARGISSLNPKVRIFAIVLFLLFSVRYFFNPAFVTPVSDRSIPEMAAELKRLTDKNTAKVLIQGTHTLLYYSDRYGWPFLMDNPERKVSDYYTKMNWERLPAEQWSLRNKAFESPESALEYRRHYDRATHLAASDYKAFKGSALAPYLYIKYKVVYEKPGVGVIFDLREMTVGD